MKNNQKRTIPKDSYWVLLSVVFLGTILCNTGYCLHSLGALPLKEEIKQDTRYIKERIINEKCKNVTELGKAGIIEAEKYRPIQQSVAFSVKETESLLGSRTYLTANIVLGIPPEVYRSNLNMVQDEPLIVMVDNENFLLPLVSSSTSNRLAYGIGRDKKIINADYLLTDEVISKLMGGHNTGYKLKLAGNGCVFQVKGDFTSHNIENLKKIKH